MPTLIEDIKFSYGIRGFSSASNDTTDTNKSNAGEEVRANIQFRVEIVSKANVLNGDTFTTANISGSTNSLIAGSANFITDNFRVGDVFDFNDIAGATVYTGAIILLISGNYIEFDDTASSIPDATYTDAEVKLASELNTLRYNYNFTTPSNPTDLVQQLLLSVQGFKYTGLTSVGSFQTGVAYVPTRGNTGSSKAKRLATTVSNVQFFEIEHNFIVLPSGNEAELVNLETLSSPNPYRIETVFYPQNVDLGIGTDDNTLRNIDLPRLTNDSVGWRNENFNGGANDYVLDSISYEQVGSGEVLTEIEAKSVTKVTAVISRLTGTFVTTNPYIVYHSYLPLASAFQSSTEDYKTTWIYENLLSTIDAGTTSGTIITNLTAVLAANVLTVDFEIQYNVSQLEKIFNDGAYELYIDLEDAALTAENSNRVALKLDARRLKKNPDITGLVTMTKAEFYNHTLDFVDGVSTGFTMLEMWNEEGIMLDSLIKVDVGTDLVEIDKIDVSVIAYDSVNDTSFIIKSNEIPISTLAETLQGTDKIQQLDLDSTKNFLLKPLDQFNLLKIVNKTYSAGFQDYAFQIGIKTPWQFWQKLFDADGSFLDTSKPNNGLNLRTSNYSEIGDYVIKINILIKMKVRGIITDYNFRSPNFRVFDYEKDRNPSPKYTADAVFKDENGNAISSNIMQDEDTNAIWTFDDGSVKTDIAVFEAITRLQVFNQGTDDSIHEISSLRGVLSGDILKPLVGETNLKKTIVSDDYTTECLINGLLLGDKKYSISTRLYDMFVVAYSTNSLIFGGVNQRLECGTAIDFESDDAFSLNAWVFLNSVGVSQYFFGKYAGSDVGLDRGYWFGANGSNELTFQIKGSTSKRLVARSVGTLSINTWYMVTFTYDGSQVIGGCKFYIDAVLQTKMSEVNTLLPAPPTIKNSSEFVIGDRSSLGNQVPFDGYIDEATCWDAEISAGNITTLLDVGCPESPSSTNLLSYWRMGEGDTFPTINDNQSSSDGTMINMSSGDITNVAPC